MQWVVEGATVFGSVGTVLAVVWAIIAFNLNVRSDKTAQFRAAVASISPHFGELAYSYETRVIELATNLFSCTNPNHGRMVKTVTECINADNKEECREKLKANQVILKNYVMFSIPVHVIDYSMSKRVETETAIMPVSHHSKTLHMFLRSAADIVFRVYRQNLGADRLQEMMPAIVLDVWDYMHEYGWRPNSDEELIEFMRERFLVYEVQLDSETKVVEVLDKIDLVVRLYLDHHSRLSEKSLWKRRRIAKKAPEDLYGRKATETMCNVLTYDTAMTEHDYGALANEVTRLEAMIGE